MIIPLPTSVYYFAVYANSIMIELCTMVIIHTVDADLEILMSVPLHLLFLYGVSDLVLVSISAWSSFFRAPFNEVLVLESPIFLI